ncbi:uncharacterized protein EI90DRAFT_3039445, partial [Cantharellus anzutake]|uniref:uncharacterized protein n=1 Tax=Cantharellus anzutake TaxID=1750568 RepID=UPI001906113F
MHHILHAHCYNSPFVGCVEESNQLPPIDDHLQRLHDFLLSRSFSLQHQTLVGAALGVQYANESVTFSFRAKTWIIHLQDNGSPRLTHTAGPTSSSTLPTAQRALKGRVI